MQNAQCSCCKQNSLKHLNAHSYFKKLQNIELLQTNCKQGHGRHCSQQYNYLLCILDFILKQSICIHSETLLKNDEELKKEIVTNERHYINYPVKHFTSLTIHSECVL